MAQLSDRPVGVRLFFLRCRPISTTPTIPKPGTVWKLLVRNPHDFEWASTSSSSSISLSRLATLTTNYSPVSMHSSAATRAASTAWAASTCIAAYRNAAAANGRFATVTAIGATAAASSCVPIEANGRISTLSSPLPPSVDYPSEENGQEENANPAKNPLIPVHGGLHSPYAPT